MKTLKALTTIGLLVFGLSASAQLHLLTDTNGVVLQHSGFFAANSNAIKTAIGYSGPGGGGGGSGTSVGVDGADVSPINLTSSWYGRMLVVGTNVSVVPKLVPSASGATFTPDFSLGMAQEFTLTGPTTLAAPTGVTTNMVGSVFRLVFIQDGTGGRFITNTAANYHFGADITGLTLRTNASNRDYVAVYVRATNSFDVIGFVRGY